MPGRNARAFLLRVVPGLIGAPRETIPCPEQLLLWAPSAAAGGFYADAGAGSEFPGAFAGKGFFFVAGHNYGLAGKAGFAACQSPWLCFACGAAAICEQRHLCIAEQFNFADE